MEATELLHTSGLWNETQAVSESDGNSVKRLDQVKAISLSDGNPGEGNASCLRCEIIIPGGGGGGGGGVFLWEKVRCADQTKTLDPYRYQEIVKQTSPLGYQTLKHAHKGSTEILNIEMVFPNMGISVISIRLSHDRLIFIMRIHILVRRLLYKWPPPSYLTTCLPIIELPM